MTKSERDDDLLAILYSQSDQGREWVEAGTVARAYNYQHALGSDGLSAVGVGRVLARLASQGRCDRQVGFMSVYRNLSPQ